MKKRYAFLVDSARCIGCASCTMACKNFNQLEPVIAWREVYPLAEAIYPHRERAFYSLACNHCEHPTCLRVCPVRAYEKREDGIVAHNQERCIGCHNCVRSCPYGAPQYNPVEKRAEKCSMCHERIDAGLSPACVQACLVSALTLVDLETLNQPNAVQFPAGYPAFPQLNPGTRFIVPKMPRQIRG